MPSLQEYYGDYTADVVFKRGKGYMTQRQAKEERNLQKERRSLNRARLAATTAATAPVPAAPSTAPVVFKPPQADVRLPERYVPPTLPGTQPAPGAVPPWWIATAYTNPDESQQFANAVNALLPTLSPEDQRSMANYLATNYKDVFGGYANAQFAPIPTRLTRERRDYINPARAQSALGLLDRVQQTAGGTPGAGYDFLKQALDLMNKYSSGASPLTREQYTQFETAFKNLLGQQGSNLSSYSNLAQLFNLPSFSAGNLMSNAPIARLNT